MKIKSSVLYDVLLNTLFVFVVSALSASSGRLVARDYDIVVYGGTSSGIIAAVQAAGDGKKVVLIESSHRIGGMTTSALGMTDHGKKKTIGGLSLEFYLLIAQKYGKTGGGPEWRFEPKVALEVCHGLIEKHSIPVVYRERLDLKDGVVKEGARIRSIKMESGKIFKGKMFIDATYEGDLMALAGIGYTVGREPNSMYGEELNGIVESQHQFGIPGIDPYLERGKPESGLLPWVQPGLGGNYGDGDKKIMAYCFRMCLTNVPDNRVMIEKPEGYDESEYELLFRAFEKGFPAHACFQLSRIPNQKTDSNMGSGHSTNHIGANWNYPEADYETRETIRQAHEIYQRGYVWTVQNHPRVPEKVRNTLKTWGLAKDEFTDTNNWPPQLYVRESRRMVSDYVVSEQEIFQKKLPAKPVGLASYNVDSHPVQYCVGENGLVRTEGGTLRTPPKAYQLDYGVIVPKKRECDNLLVSVCVSASHSAYSSLRMEPVYMILGQSAAVAAAEAIDKKLAVQDIAYADLRKRLLDVGQILEDNDDKPFAMDDGGNPQWK